MRSPRSLVLAALCLLPLVLSAQTQSPAAPSASNPAPAPTPAATATPIAATHAATPTPAAPSATALLSADVAQVPSLHNAQLDLVLDLLSTWTGRTILRPTVLPTATITLDINHPVTKAEAVQAVLSVLNLNGIGAIEMGDKFLKIVPLAAQARAEASEMITGSTLGLPTSGKIASKVFELHNLKANEAAPQLNSILSLPLGGVAFFPSSNAILVTDSIANLQRIERLLKIIDRSPESGAQPKFYQLHYAKASDLLGKIQTLLKAPNFANFANSASLNADDRTNQIILLAPPDQFGFYDKLVEKLDTVADPNTQNVVIFIKHAVAGDIATLLSSIVSGQNSGGSGKGPAGSAGTTASRTAGTTGSSSSTTANRATGSTSGSSASGSSTAASGTSSGGAPVSFNNANATLGLSQFSPLLTVASDSRSNSIVVSGTRDDINLIRDLVNKLDVVLPQVRIEVVIAEITLTDTDSSGIQSLNLALGSNGAIGNFTVNGAPELSSQTPGWSATGTVDPRAFTLALNTMGVNNHMKVLSAPTIVTTTNNLAEVAVGEQLPIITGTTSTPNGTSDALITSSEVTYKTIAIDLQVTPIIGDDGLVQMTINQQVNDIVGNVTIDGNSQPIIGTRTATAFVSVKDGQMIVLGGLQQTQKVDNKDKLGFIYEIPPLSWLFGGHSTENVRTELLLFIRPHIITPDISTPEAQREIDHLSDHKDVNTYLKDNDFKVPVTPTGLQTTVIVQQPAKH